MFPLLANEAFKPPEMFSSLQDARHHPWDCSQLTHSILCQQEALQADSLAQDVMFLYNNKKKYQLIV